MTPLFARLLKERQYLKNVSPPTIQWHEQGLFRHNPVKRERITEPVVGNVKSAHL